MSSWNQQSRPHAIKNEAVICAIALHEERYIDEWIAYHLKLGFYHIFIYDNSDNYVLQHRKSDRVSVLHHPGKAKQLEVYNLFVLHYKRKFKWAAFIDIDEFIVLKKHKTIMDLLHAYDDCSTLVLHWRMFGTNHEVIYRDEPVTKRFQKCSTQLHHHFKSICQLQHIHNYSSPHMPTLVQHKHAMNTSRSVIQSLYEYDGPSDIACIHHYYTKSEQEFREKIGRGRADIPEKKKHH